MKKRLIALCALSFVLLITACINQNDSEPRRGHPETKYHINPDYDTHEHVHHSGSGDVPEALRPAKRPTFPIGTKAIIMGDHMPSMEGAIATIVGAYDTIAYVVSYTSTEARRVENHKWVVHEEFRNAPPDPYPNGALAMMEADHMPGMNGAIAEIVSSEATTVYMINFTSTAREEVTNHKWVTEDELAKME